MTDQDKQRIAEWCERKPERLDWRDKLNQTKTSDKGFWTWRSCYWVHSSFSTLDACAEFEQVVFDRGLRREYGAALLKGCCATGVRFEFLDKSLIGFIAASATPAQRVGAILAVIKGTKP